MLAKGLWTGHAIYNALTFLRDLVCTPKLHDQSPAYVTWGAGIAYFCPTRICAGSMCVLSLNPMLKHQFIARLSLEHFYRSNILHLNPKAPTPQTLNPKP